MMTHQHLHLQNALQQRQEMLCSFTVLWAERSIPKLPSTRCTRVHQKQTANFKRGRNKDPIFLDFVISGLDYPLMYMLWWKFLQQLQPQWLQESIYPSLLFSLIFWRLVILLLHVQKLFFQLIKHFGCISSTQLFIFINQKHSTFETSTLPPPLTKLCR